MAFDIQDDSFFDMDADSGKEKLETYGIWIKKEPEDVLDSEETQNTDNADDLDGAFSFMDKTEQLETNAPDMSLTEDVAGDEFGLEQSSDDDWEPDFSSGATIPLDTPSPSVSRNEQNAETVAFTSSPFDTNEASSAVSDSYTIEEMPSFTESAASFTEEPLVTDAVSFDEPTTDEKDAPITDTDSSFDALPSLDEESSFTDSTDGEIDAITESPFIDDSAFIDENTQSTEVEPLQAESLNEDTANGDFDSDFATTFTDSANAPGKSDETTSALDELDDLDDFSSAANLASSIDETYPIEPSENLDEVQSEEVFQNAETSEADSAIPDSLDSKESALDDFDDVFASSPVTDSAFESETGFLDEPLSVPTEDELKEASFAEQFAETDDGAIDTPPETETDDTAGVAEESALSENADTIEENGEPNDDEGEVFDTSVFFDSEESDFAVDTAPELDEVSDLPSFDDITEEEKETESEENAPMLDLTDESFGNADDTLQSLDGDISEIDSSKENGEEDAFFGTESEEAVTDTDTSVDFEAFGDKTDGIGFAQDGETLTDTADAIPSFGDGDDTDSIDAELPSLDDDNAGGDLTDEPTDETQSFDDELPSLDDDSGSGDLAENTETDLPNGDADITDIDSTKESGDGDALINDETSESAALSQDQVPTVETIGSFDETDDFTEETENIPTVETALSSFSEEAPIKNFTQTGEPLPKNDDPTGETEAASEKDDSLIKGMALGAGIGLAGVAAAALTAKDDTDSTATESKSADELEDGEISLDSFLDDSESDDVSSEFGISSGGDDFGDDFLSELNAEFSGEKEETAEMVEEKPIDIDLEFDDQFVSEMQTDASERIEDNEDFSDVLSSETETIEDNFDDIFGNIVDETAPSSEKPADVLADTSASADFDEVDDFNDILNSVNGPSMESEAKQEKKPQKKIDYDITVETDEADTHKAPTMELSTEYDTNESIPLFASKEENNVNKQLDITEKQEYTEIQEDEHNMNFDDITAAPQESEAPVTPAEDTSAYESNDSKAILKEISGELAMLRSEISALKEELNKYKSQGVVASQAEEAIGTDEESVSAETDSIQDDIELPEPSVDTSSSSGFFDGDVEDETIALSGDELTNILNSADFTEEFVDNTEDIAAANGIDFDEKLEEPNLDDVQLPDSNFDDGTDTVIEDSADITEENAESAVPNEIPLPKVEEADETDQIEDSFIDKSEPITADSLSNDTINYLEEESTEETPLDLPEIEENDSEDAPSETIDENTENFETPVVPPAEDDGDGFDDVIGSATQEDELPEFDTIGDEGEIESIVTSPLETELNLSEEESPLAAPEEMPIGEEAESAEDEAEADSPFAEPDDTPSEAVFASDQWQDEDVSSDEDSLNEESSEVPLDTDTATAEEPNSMLGKASQLIADKEGTTDLKDEIKSVLVYMDQLLENLPEEKIEEFAKSEYFETYKKLFKELGLS